MPYDPKTGWKLADVPTLVDDAPDDDTCNMIREASTAALRKHQRRLFASPYSVLIILQAMDTGGKDGLIRKVLTGIDPAGCQIYGFKQPSAQEMEHDWLHRTRKLFPERGRIGVFNRSYYEETLVVRVHPQYLRSYGLQGMYADAQYSEPVSDHILWRDRFTSIRDMELHAARNNTVILKFMLHMSKDVQGKRLLARVNTPVKHWKFSAADLNERQHWDNYQRAYQDVLEATSRPWAPWYVVPADNKPYCQMVVAGIIEEAVAMLKLEWPKASGSNVARIQDARKILEQELASTKDIDDLKGSHEKEWGTLADSEKKAAQNLGYDQETWSKKKRVEHREHSAVFAEMVEKKIRESKWYSMPAFKQFAALEIGYVAETWNNPDYEVPLRAKKWTELTDGERIACKNLGYTERSWDFLEQI